MQQSSVRRACTTIRRRTGAIPDNDLQPRSAHGSAREPRATSTIGEKAYEAQFEARRLTSLKEAARGLGYTLVQEPLGKVRFRSADALDFIDPKQPYDPGGAILRRTGHPDALIHEPLHFLLVKLVCTANVVGVPLDVANLETRGVQVDLPDRSDEARTRWSPRRRLSHESARVTTRFCRQ